MRKKYTINIHNWGTNLGPRIHTVTVTTKQRCPHYTGGAYSLNNGFSLLVPKSLQIELVFLCSYPCLSCVYPSCFVGFQVSNEGKYHGFWSTDQRFSCVTQRIWQYHVVQYSPCSSGTEYVHDACLISVVPNASVRLVPRPWTQANVVNCWQWVIFNLSWVS